MPINKKSSINNIITWLHLWLGLVSGIIVVILSVTGCLFSFQEEITNWTQKQERFIEAPAPAAQTLPLSELKSRAQAAFGTDHPITYITTYKDRDRSWEFMSYEIGDAKAISFPGTIKTYASVFLNPFTGAVTGKINYMDDFFVIVKYIHWSLYLNTAIGQPITGWATLLFVVLLITGIIMWYPKRWSKKNRDNSLKIKWRAKFKRLNYDLHNVLGFYTFLIALILGLTGMVFAFQWFQKTVYATAALTTSPQTYKVFNSDTAAIATVKSPLDKAFLAIKAAYPGAQSYSTNPVSGKTATITMSANNSKSTFYHQNTLYFDQYTGAQLGKQPYSSLNAGEKVLAMNYDIHVGAIGGLMGKIIAFLVSLVSASLPITGFYIWWGKRKKKQKKSLKQKKIWNKYQDHKNGLLTAKTPNAAVMVQEESIEP